MKAFSENTLLLIALSNYAAACGQTSIRIDADALEEASGAAYRLLPGVEPGELCVLQLVREKEHDRVFREAVSSLTRYSGIPRSEILSVLTALGEVNDDLYHDRHMGTSHNLDQAIDLLNKIKQRPRE